MQGTVSLQCGEYGHDLFSVTNVVKPINKCCMGSLTLAVCEY